MKFILASQSPIRKRIMDMLQIPCEVIVSNCDESFEDGLTIEEQSKRLAFIKAKVVFDKTQGDRIVIGSDSMVLKGKNIYGKPKDKAQAVTMLNDLKNDTHTVITSLAVLIQEGDKYIEKVDYDKARLYFKDMTEEEIDRWIEEDKPYDKAGGYAVQSKFAVFIDKIDGNYFTAMGLPVHKLYDVIKQYL